MIDEGLYHGQSPSATSSSSPLNLCVASHSLHAFLVTHALASCGLHANVAWTYATCVAHHPSTHACMRSMICVPIGYKLTYACVDVT